MMIGTLRDTEVRADVARYRARVAALAGRLAEQRDGIAGLLAALAKDGPALMAVCEASGVIVRLGVRTVSLGNAPEGAAATDLLDTLMGVAPLGGEAFATAETGSLLTAQQAEALRDRAAGALLLPLIHAPGDCVVWVRPEQARTVRWGGDPSAQLDGEAISGVLSPRRSFAAWKQEVRGQSVAWTPAQIEAAYGLRRAIDHALVHCAEFELVRLRQHDALTGLPNRRLLREWLDTWAHERPDGYLLIVEIDRFKSLNEAVGEKLGDRVLIDAAARIARVAAGPAEMVARIGSAAFGVFGHAMDLGAGSALAEALRTAMAEPFELGGKPIRVTASVGIVPAGADTAGYSADEMMARADIALQSASARGGNRSQMFGSELRSGAGRRMDIEQELRAVLDGDSARAGAFRLAYQPCVALSNNNAGVPPLRGFEALLRWEHPRLGNIPPGEFIGIAENCGLIEAVGDWVMRQAIAQIADWRGMAGGLPYATWRVAVNVSPHQLARPAFAAEVIALLAERDLPPHCLTIEVTEGVFSDERAAAVVAEMRQSGLKIAVDDFGIGYSSLSCLRRLPVDELKLDRSFLQRSDGGALHEDLLGALVQLARSVGLSVLAEGVETEEHLAAVSAAGCDAAQGWLFARALPPDEAAEWIAGASAIAITENARPKLPFSFRDIVEAANEAVVVTDADLDAPGPIIVYVNPAFSRMTGWKLGDVLGKSPRMLQGPKTNNKVLTAMTQALREGRSAHARAVNYARSGMPYWCEIHASPLHDQHGRVTHFVAIERDVTHTMRRLDDLEALVERDPLTGIANRRGLERFAASLPAQANLPLCVAYIDIDRFKDVNDSFGHATGDALLLGLADLLCENMRRADFIGRLGGDEFLICMPSILPSDARSVAERLHRAVAAHAFETPVGPLRINCSVGVAVMRPDDPGLAEVIARADAALYQAKLAGRGRVAVDGLAQGAEVDRGEWNLALPRA
jgi:diguanylate cyclase (GGDEF)-like protein/PAS domain S-box-containing protein